jgi:capsular exopolysaccharide synthesis family protein
MSRIQDVLRKAEREGTARRTRALADDSLPALTVPPDLDSRRRAPAAPDGFPPRVGPLNGRASASAAVARDPARVGSGPRLAVDRHLVAMLAPDSFPAEQYRSLRTRILQAESKALRLLLVTSPQKAEGKSLTSANLALTMAQELNRRVVLVDADLRNPSVHRLFAIAQGPGFADVLAGTATIEDALVSIPESNLAVMPAGVRPAHPAELLGSSAVRRVLDTLRSRFDRVVLDTPPAGPLTDVRVLAALVDGALLVVRAARTHRPSIERALGEIDPAKVLGLVLNDTTTTAAAYGYPEDGSSRKRWRILHRADGN